MTTKELITEVEKLGLGTIMDDAGNFLVIYDSDQLIGTISLLREKSLLYAKALQRKDYKVKFLNLLTEYALTPVNERSDKKYMLKVHGQWISECDDYVIVTDQKELAKVFKAHEIEVIEVNDD